MNIKSIFLNLTLFGCLQFSSITNAAEPGEGIVFDPLTGNYTVSYFVELDDGSKLLQKTFFEPATKIDPSVQSKFRLDGGNAVLYRYTVSSGDRSQQVLGTVRLDLIARISGVQELPTTITAATEMQAASVIDANRRALATPLGWDGSTHSSQPGKVRVSWDTMGGKGIQPGNALTGFGFSSLDIPGIGTAQFVGNRKRVTTYAGEGPQGDVKQQFDALQQKDFVPRNAAVPMVTVPTPFDPAVTLERIQTHMHTWIGMQLLDATFSAQLDRSFQSAISAYRLNQPKVGKKQIQTMRELLKKEHADADRGDDNDDRGEKGDHADKNKTQRALIDKLAARILDFDLKYVMKRAGGDKDD